MTQEKLEKTLLLHKTWYTGVGFGGKRANLSCEDLSCRVFNKANLDNVNLSSSDLTRATISYSSFKKANLRSVRMPLVWACNAKFCYANLQNASMHRGNFYGADFSGANLRFADLRGADLRLAKFKGCDLTGTVLDPKNKPQLPSICEIRYHGMSVQKRRGIEYVYGWRTEASPHIGICVYHPRKGPYVAPVFSIDGNTPCHPGIYIAGEDWLREEYCDQRLVRCFCRRDELVHAGDKWRCKRLWVVNRE